MSTEKITATALQFWLKKLNLKQGDLVERTGIAQGHISNMMNGRRGMTTENIERICDAFGITIPEFFSCNDYEKPHVEFIPLLKARPKAGTGGLETDAEVKGWYSFHQSFLVRKQGTVDTMRLFNVSGDSMAPTIHDNDMILINTSQKEITTGNIYLVRIDDELMVKRVETRPNMIVLKSDNPDYAPIEIFKTDEDINWEVHGRMVWLCREY